MSTIRKRASGQVHRRTGGKGAEGTCRGGAVIDGVSARTAREFTRSASIHLVQNVRELFDAWDARRGDCRYGRV